MTAPVTKKILERAHRDHIYIRLTAHLSLAAMQWIEERRKDPRPYTEVERELETVACAHVDAFKLVAESA